MRSRPARVRVERRKELLSYGSGQHKQDGHAKNIHVTRGKVVQQVPSRGDVFPRLREVPLYDTLVHMIKEKIPELQKLSTGDKFALAVELWDELSSNPDEIPVTEERVNELDRRFEEYRQDPHKVVTWEEAKARILSGRR